MTARQRRRSAPAAPAGSVPGVARRLWDARDRLRPAREPEIARVDLAATLLGVLAWGGDPQTFEWFEAPPPRARGRRPRPAEAARARLDGRAVTPLGHQLRRLPLHPRLGRVLLRRAAAVRSRRRMRAALRDAASAGAMAAATTCDLLPLIDRWSEVPSHTRRVAEPSHRFGGCDAGRGRSRRTSTKRHSGGHCSPGYPDRVARRRATDRQRVVLASGRGAAMGRESRVRRGRMAGCARRDRRPRRRHAEALVRMAAAVAPEWICRRARDRASVRRRPGTVRAVEVARYDEIVVRERPVTPTRSPRGALLARAWLRAGAGRGDAAAAARARFAGVELDLPAVVRRGGRYRRARSPISDRPRRCRGTTKQRLNAGAPGVADRAERPRDAARLSRGRRRHALR